MKLYKCKFDEIVSALKEDKLKGSDSFLLDREDCNPTNIDVVNCYIYSRNKEVRESNYIAPPLPFVEERDDGIYWYDCVVVSLGGVKYGV